MRLALPSVANEGIEARAVDVQVQVVPGPPNFLMVCTINMAFCLRALCGANNTPASPAARPMGGNRPYALAGQRDWLLKRLADQPDVTLRALVAELAARGIKISYYAMWHFFEHEGISFKKAFTPANRIGPTWPGGGHDGSACNTSSIQDGSSSSMRPGPRPT